MVRPGITGWAQVNGGALLSAIEKDELDAWYVANSSLWVDLRIAWMTIISFVSGDRRPRQALTEAPYSTNNLIDLPELATVRRDSVAVRSEFKDEEARASTALSS
jgi:hypothetical protein